MADAPEETLQDTILSLIGSLLREPVREPESDESDKICPNYEQTIAAPGGTDASAASSGAYDTAAYDTAGYGAALHPAELLDFIRRLQNAQEATRQDPNFRLLQALRPYLSRKRRARIRSCEQILTICKIVGIGASAANTQQTDLCGDSSVSSDRWLIPMLLLLLIRNRHDANAYDDIHNIHDIHDGGPDGEPGGGLLDRLAELRAGLPLDFLSERDILRILLLYVAF